jgi:copper(I)-binding protein
MLKKLFAIFALIFITLSFSGCAPEATNELPRVGIIIEKATVTVGDTDAKVFASITNRADGTVTLTGVKTSAAESSLIVDRAGSAEQTLKDGVEIHVGQTLELRENGKHIFIMVLLKPITFGDKLNLTFEFDGAVAQTIRASSRMKASWFLVRSSGSMPAW